MSKAINWGEPQRREMSLNWEKEAASGPPSPQGWIDLAVELRKAATEYAEPKNDSPSARRRLIMGMLLELKKFVSSEPALNDVSLESGFNFIFAALFEIENNVQPELFTAKRTREDGRPPLNTAQAKTKGAAARGLAELINANPDLTPNQAADRIARAVKAGKCAGYEACTAKRVTHWLDDLRQGPALNGKRSVALDRFEADLPPQAGTTAQSKADFILACLRLGEGFR